MLKILWADDEIDLLKPHILFLQHKGYEIITATNGNDALKIVASTPVDLIFLDENMPGLNGLKVLSEIKKMLPNIPVVMITKNEEENIMEQAIGSKISDYLIKPVNPNQILLSIKKNTENKRLIQEQNTVDYQAEFSRLGMLIQSAVNIENWKEIYRRLVYWELEMSGNAQDMEEVLRMQKTEANKEFSKFIKNNYAKWFRPEVKEKPALSTSLVKNYLLPALNEHKHVLFLVVDNLRYDQWKVLATVVNDYCKIDQDDLYCGILPTSTQYARNAIFSGLMPLEIEKIYPKLWIGEDDEGDSKNAYEEELLRNQLARLGYKESFYFEKVKHDKTAKKLTDHFSNYKNHQLTVLVYNFIDSISHARTDVEMIRELANDEKAYRSLTLSWFKNSNLQEIIKTYSGAGYKIVLTTDHGTVRVFNPVKVVGDRDTSSNLRYKMGRNLNYNPKEVYEVRKPSDIHLPIINLTSTFIFALEADFLVYPNNYNHFVNYYKNTFQHGGISMEEMLVPVVGLSGR